METRWIEGFDKIAKGSLNGWLQIDQDKRERVYDLVARWIGGNRKELAQAIRAALNDGTFSDEELLGILAIIGQSASRGSVLGSAFFTDLFEHLKDGQLSSREIAEVALAWAAGRTSIGPLKDLLKAASKGSLSTSDLRDAILSWIASRGEAPLADALRSALSGSGPLTTGDVVAIVSSYLIQTGRLKATGSSINDFQDALKVAIRALDNDELIPLLDALVDQNYSLAARSVLGLLGITADENLIQALLAGKLEEALLIQLKSALGGATFDSLVQPLLDQDFETLFRKQLGPVLKPLITNISDAQAGDLAAAIFRILSGKDELIPSQTEREELQMDPPEYQVWVRVRKVLYAAELAAAGGPLVPTEAMARPHIFAAAAIGFQTPVKTLAPEKQWPLLLECIKQFCAAEFQRPMGVPINLALLKDGRAARHVHFHVTQLLG